MRSKYLTDGQVTGQKICEFEYFNIGDVTFNQLSVYGITPKTFDGRYSNKRPDRLIVKRRNKTTPEVIAVIEDKDGGMFGNDLERKKAIQQCNNYCQEVGAKIGIITDGTETIWINPRDKNKDNTYIDVNTQVERSYARIKNEDNTPVKDSFYFRDRTDVYDIDSMSDELKEVYKLINAIAGAISESNSIIREPNRIDPLPLARSVWQDIWIATGKTPEKCLYNVVELFIFKFLSDLGILANHNSFDFLYGEFIKGKRENEIDSEGLLKHYVQICRKAISDSNSPESSKFPKGSDGTTIINGTIFVDESGNANITQASLFKDTLIKFKDFEKKYGKFSAHNIDKDFKTKLYEKFLKQTAGLKALGQYFTPRVVVRAVVDMSNISVLHEGARVCDPFCGVGGFILEPLNLPSRADDFRPVNGKIKSPITYVGYDKGFEKDEERTIILAKANMLIYLADIIAEYPNLTREFANDAFNKTFKLWRSNLGTLESTHPTESEQFDLILTNPPYVKSGIKALKNEIEAKGELRDFYTVNGGGLEGLAIEWIVRHLKVGGRAFIIVPDGIFHRNEDKKLRKFLLDECYIDAVVSLPVRTFYATPKKTYILAITKKKQREHKQTTPVFTYLVSHIGETLDINRFVTEKNDLADDMVPLFRQFDGAKEQPAIKERLEGQSKRCKVQPIEAFDLSHHWLVDRWWTKEEKIALDIEETEELLSLDEFMERLKGTELLFRERLASLPTQRLQNTHKREYQDVYLGDITQIVRGDSQYTLKYINDHPGEYPLYSAKTEEDGLMGRINSFKFDEECVTYTTNGANAGTVFYREKHKFSLNGDAAILRIKPELINQISYRYLAIAVRQAFKVEGLGWEYKATNGKVSQVIVKLPVDKSGAYDKHAQVLLADEQDRLESLQRELSDQLALVSEAKVSIGD